MIAQQGRFSWLVRRLGRKLTGRFARCLCGAVLLILITFMAAVRIRSVLLIRRIEVVLSGLSKIRADQTTEGDLRKLLSVLVRHDLGHDGQHPNLSYGIDISNEGDMRRLMALPTFEVWHGACGKSVLKEVAYWLGYRYIHFRAGVSIQGGKVESVGYRLELENTDCGMLLSAQSVHGFWAIDRTRRNDPNAAPVPVSSIEDQSPAYRIKGNQEWIEVIYAFDAPLDVRSHAFQVDLRCLWSIRGCGSLPPVAPTVWSDKAMIEAATSSRLKSGDPCPDSTLAERVHYLPDLNVELLEVVRSKLSDVNEEGQQIGEIITDYRLKEVVHGRADGPFTGVRWLKSIPDPLAPKGQIANPVTPFVLKPGDLMLYFTGAKFDSCRMVPATPSAVLAIRNAAPPTRRPEDDISLQWGRF